MNWLALLNKPCANTAMLLAIGLQTHKHRFCMRNRCENMATQRKAQPQTFLLLQRPEETPLAIEAIWLEIQPNLKNSPLHLVRSGELPRCAALSHAWALDVFIHR